MTKINYKRYKMAEGELEEIMKEFERGRKSEREKMIEMIEKMFKDNHSIEGWSYDEALEELKIKIKELEKTK